jgi:hypothetical protein
MEDALISAAAPPPTAATAAFPKSPRRWLVLLAFSLSNALNAYLWISLAPVANVAAARFSVPIASVDWFSLSFMVLFAPGAVLSIVWTEVFGLRSLLLCAAAANFASALVRWLSVFAPSAGGLAFGIALLGQSISALAQPAFINAPARISGTWFGAGEQALATTVAAMSNVVGNALGSALPPAFTSAPGDIDAGLLGAAVASAAVLVVSLVAITADAPAEPASAASASRALARRALQDHSAVGAGAGAGAGDGSKGAVLVALRTVRADFRDLLANRNFVALLVGFGIGLGLFNALLTLLSQTIAPCSYGNDTAGSAGAALLGAGLVGAAIAGAALDSTQAFAPLLQLGIALALASMLFLLSSLRPGAEGALIASFGVTGAFLMPLLPLALENAAEASFPVSEDNSASLMLGMGNYVGLACVFVLEALLPLPAVSSCASVLTPSAGLLLGLMAAAAVAILGFYRADYRRSKAAVSSRGDYSIDENRGDEIK